MPDPRTIESLPPAMLEAIRRDAEHFPSVVRSKGRDYLADGRVGPLEIGDGRIAATVRGSRPYRTSWRWTGGGVDPSCTCPVGPLCKHAYAVALAAVSEYEAASADAPRDATTNAFAPRPPTRRRDPAIEALRTAEPWNRAYAFGRVVAAGRGRGVFLSPYEFRAILDDPDPDLMCWRLAQEIPKRSAGWLPHGLEGYRDRPDLAARAEERTRHELEEGLARWARRHAAAPPRSLRVLLGLVFDEEGAPVVTAQARVTTPRLSDEPRSAQQLVTLANELRRDAGLLAPPHARLLRALTAGVPGAARRDHDHVFRLDAATLGRLLDNFADTALVTWGEDGEPALRARAGIATGDRIHYHDEPLDILPVCVDDAAGMRIALAARWPGGTHRTLDSIVHLESDDDLHPSLVLADGAFRRVGEAPPHDLLQRFTTSGSLPVPEHGREPFLEILAASFASVAEALEPHTRRHDARPVIALALDANDWIELRLFAHTGETWRPGGPAGDVAVFEYTPDGRWARVTAADAMGGEFGAVEAVPEDAAAAAAAGEPPPAHAGNGVADGVAAPAVDISADRVAGAVAPVAARAHAPAGNVWLEAPDPARVEPAREWLVSLVPPGDGRAREAAPRAGWWLKLTTRNLERFAEAWDHRPAGTNWVGNRAMRDLLGGARTVRPSVRVVSSGVDWFSISAEWESEGLALTEADLAKLRAARTRFVKLPSGWVRRDLAERHDADAALLADLGVEAGAGEQRVSLWQLAQARRESLTALEDLGADPATLAALDELRRRVREFRGLPKIAPPAGLVAELRPYQREGLDFLAFVTGLGRGAVLADDMGLGKTVQALAWLLHLREREPGLGPALVVCPASVVHNWVREAERFTPGLRVLALTSGEGRHELRREIPDHDLVVTNYALLRRDLAEWKDVALSAAILDEAQNIKNPDAAVSRGALTLNAKHRLALTGTPLENRALDLWSIMQFVNPGYLGSRRAFSQRYDRPDAPPHLRALLSAKLRPVLLRRLKRQVATDLPDRIEERLDCPLTEGQRKLYVAEMTNIRNQLQHAIVSPEDYGKRRFEILAALTRLRQVCCHPALIGGRRALGSGKFDALFELLEPLLQEGHKVLLFSQFVELLELLREDFAARGVRHHMLTGSTTKREQVVRAFEEDPEPCVFLISLKAGGTGLNLTAASYVVLFDPWWNPAVEAQAIDRTHRIGQTRTVIAYRMLAEGTIEERIWELQQKKAALAREVIGEDGFARTLTGKDLEFLLSD